MRTPVEIRSVWEKPFCRLLYFDRKLTRPLRKPQPRVLIVAPMSGHYATLLRGTVEAFLPTHEVYITDWSDARMVPVTEGRFDLDDYVDYVIEMLHVLGGNMHVIAVCQPSVPVVAAVSVMEAERDPYVPLSMTLMGGPIDTRRNPTAVNNLAAERGIDWFRNHVITKVPFPHPGVMRDVYPGFLQLNGFISMNLDRHMDAHKNLFKNLVKGDGDLVDKHRDFYDEYLAVMDLTGRILSADRRYRVRQACAAEGRDDPSRQAGRSFEDHARGADDGRRRERRHFRSRPDRGRRTRCAVRFPPIAACITCKRASVITACSTARASNRKSCRAFPISWCRAANTKPSLVAAAAEVNAAYRADFALSNPGAFADMERSGRPVTP